MHRFLDKSRLIRWAGWTVAGCLALFLTLNVYWGFGGKWGMTEVMGAPGFEPPVWVMWAQAAVVATAMVAVLGRSGILRLPIPVRFLNAVVWLLAGILAVVAMGNFASPSPWERYVLGPLALVLAALTGAVASSPTPPPSGAPTGSRGAR